jgi:WD40 repeat protein
VGQAALSSRRAQKEAETRADEAHKAAVLAEKQAKVRAIRDAAKQGKEDVDRMKMEKLAAERAMKNSHHASVVNAKLAAEQEELERQIATRAKLNDANASKEDKRLADEAVRRAQAAIEARRLEDREEERLAIHRAAEAELQRQAAERDSFKMSQEEQAAARDAAAKASRESAEASRKAREAHHTARVSEEKRELNSSMNQHSERKREEEETRAAARADEWSRVGSDNDLRKASFKQSEVERKHRQSMDSKRTTNISTEMGTTRSGHKSVASPQLSNTSTSFRKTVAHKVGSDMANIKAVTLASIPAKPTIRGLAKGAVVQSTYSEQYDAKEGGVRYWPFRDTVYGPSDWQRAQPYYLERGVDGIEDENKPRQLTPDKTLKLEFVYGYGGKCSQGHASANAFYCGNGTQEVVYFSAAVGIVYDTVAHAQRFYMEHDNDITAMALHPNRIHVATGQLGQQVNAKVNVWDTRTMETIRTIPESFHPTGVSVLSFSPDGKLLNSVGMDANRTIAVWNLETSGGPTRITHGKTQTENVFNAAYTADGTSVVTVGSKHIKFWSFAQDNRLKETRPNIGTLGKLQTMLCSVSLVSDGVVASEGNTVLTGTKDGEVYVWEGANLVDKWAAHDGGVFMITTCDYFKNCVITAGRDGTIKVWEVAVGAEGDHKLVKSFDFSSKSTPGMSLQAAALCAYQNKCLIGTEGNEMFEISIDSENGNVKALVQAHDDFVYGLATHPTKDVFATASDDKTVRVWDAQNQILAQCFPMQDKVQCLSFSPRGDLLAVGCTTGRFLVIESDKRSLVAVKELQERREPILDIKFSPSGNLLAVASSENKIDIYDCTSNYSRVSTCEGHSNFVTKLDWSEDDAYIRSTCCEYDLMFWETSKGSPIKNPKEMRDVQWASETCLLGWGVRGIWTKESNGADINAVARAPNQESCVTGSDDGSINLYRYPVVDEEQDHRSYSAHSSSVANVTFDRDSKRVFSAGSVDMAICQWRHQ